MTMTKKQKQWVLDHIEVGEKNEDGQLHLWVKVDNMPKHKFTSEEVMQVLQELDTAE